MSHSNIPNMMSVGSSHGVIEIPDGISLGGFAQNRPWDNQVCYPLELNVVCFRAKNRSIKDLIVISIDVTFANELFRRLQIRYSEENLNVVVAASHTHYAPSLMPEFSSLGVLDEAFVNGAIRLCEKLIQKARQLAEGAKVSSTVSEVKTSTWGVSSRRSRGFSILRIFPFLKFGVVMQPSSKSGQESPVNAFVIDTGGVKVVFWSFACHPTSFYSHNAISSEYIGVVRSEIRKRLGSSVSVVFLQGASGDLRQPHISVNPNRVGVLNTILGLLSGRISSYIRPSKTEWENWAHGLASSVVECVDGVEQGQQHECLLRYYSYSAPLKDFIGPEHPVEQLTISTIDILNVGQIVFANAEITSNLGRKLEALEPKSDHRIIATNIDECLGYLATSKEYDDGGYESVRWVKAFGCRSEVKSGTEKLILGLYKKIIHENEQ